MITAICVALFKKEADTIDSPNSQLNFINSYKVIWSLFQIKHIRVIAFVLLTAKISFGTEAANIMKLIERGVAKETFSYLLIPLMPMSIVWALLISKYTNGKKPLNLYLTALPIR